MIRCVVDEGRGESMHTVYRPQPELPSGRGLMKGGFSIDERAVGDWIRGAIPCSVPDMISAIRDSRYPSVSL